MDFAGRQYIKPSKKITVKDHGSKESTISNLRYSMGNLSESQPQIHLNKLESN